LSTSTCFKVFQQCVEAVHDGELITVSGQDKEFHFQNWVGSRLDALPYHFDGQGRNTYPDFSVVEEAEGFEVKGLACPGRDQNYDCNSQVPTGIHNGRRIFYVFGRYPSNRDDHTDLGGGRREYPVMDLVICHGDFLNADHSYVHKNKSVKGFGTYGDLMIRDRKMYVAPTPYALTEGTTGLMTLIVPEDLDPPESVQEVGRLTRVESDQIVVAYRFDLRTNELRAERVANPAAGTEHRFVAYRMKSQASKPVTMVTTAGEKG